MDIEFNCSKCRQHILIDESAAGYQVKCPTCQGDLVVPQKPAPSHKRRVRWLWLAVAGTACVVAAILGAWYLMGARGHERQAKAGATATTGTAKDGRQATLPAPTAGTATEDQKNAMTSTNAVPPSSQEVTVEGCFCVPHFECFVDYESGEHSTDPGLRRIEHFRPLCLEVKRPLPGRDYPKLYFLLTKRIDLETKKLLADIRWEVLSHPLNSGSHYASLPTSYLLRGRLCGPEAEREDVVFWKEGGGSRMWLEVESAVPGSLPASQASETTNQYGAKGYVQIPAGERHFTEAYVGYYLSEELVKDTLGASSKGWNLLEGDRLRGKRVVIQGDIGRLTATDFTLPGVRSSLWIERDGKKWAQAWLGNEPRELTYYATDEMLYQRIIFSFGENPEPSPMF